jgi:hypothetical protein
MRHSERETMNHRRRSAASFRTRRVRNLCRGWQTPWSKWAPLPAVPDGVGILC